MIPLHGSLQRPSSPASIQRAATPASGATGSAGTPAAGAAGRWNLGGLGGFAVNDYAVGLAQNSHPDVALDPAGAIVGAVRALDERGHLGS